MADVFEVQEEIAAAIAGALEVKLALKSEAAVRYKPNLPAYEAFLKGRHHWSKLTADSLERSRKCYEQAVALDPRFALAPTRLRN
jgi:serine/threonine-protein kinase